MLQVKKQINDDINVVCDESHITFEIKDNFFSVSVKELKSIIKAIETLKGDN